MTTVHVVGGDVVVRRLRASETDLFRTVRLAALAEAPDSFGETLEHAHGSNWQERTMSGASLADRAVFVAVASERAVGMVFVNRGKEGEAAFLGGMWVEPRFRRRGVGRALVQEGLGFLRAAGERQVSLWVTSDHRDALTFYEQLGFRCTGVTDALRTGSEVRITEMTLTLAPLAS